MSQVSLSIPTEKPPVSQDRILTFGLEENNMNNNVLKTTEYKCNTTDFANSFFKNHFSWEYYSNELEFE